jgi:hypothetical protein
VLDLGFFHSIQALQHEASPLTTDELIKSVEEAFQRLSHDSLDNVFLSLQKCMEASMQVGGGNNYPLPHIGITKLRREGKLPTTLFCSPEVIAEARKYLA